MSIIKKPSAVASPYIDTSPAAPVRLASAPVAGGGVNTVAATVANTVSANANANTDTGSTGSNVSYYTSGIEGINQLATYGRIFAGANVNITLEQPQYITYNQNYTGSGTVGGSNGQVQFNSNGVFGGSGNLTFDGANLVVGGNITSNYLFGNGSQLTGINASSNKIFNGNSYANIANASGNVVVGANGNLWTFAADGTTKFPDNTIKTANNESFTTRTQSSGNAYTLTYQSPNSWEAYAEDDNTGANPAYAWIKADLNTLETPRVFITNTKASDGVELTWTFDAVGNLTLPSNIASINYANGTPYGGSGSGAANKIFNGNTYANIDFPGGNLAVGVNVTPVTGAWINTYGNIVANDSGNSEGESVLIDGGGNVFVTGASYNPDFDADQAYIRKLSPSGQVMWQKSLPQSVNGSQLTSGEALAQDVSGNIYWLTNIWLDGGGNVFPMVAKLNSSTGESVWSTQIGNVYYGYDITVNSSGQVFVVTNLGGRITSLNSDGTVAWSRDPSNGGVSIVDTGTYVIVGYSAGTVGAYNYSGTLLWTNQVFNTGPDIWGLAWDGTDWYAADYNGNIMKISGADNSTILWQKHINRNGTGGNIFNTWIEYADGYIYAGGTGNDGQASDAFITVKINASTGSLVWARSLEAQNAGQWYWYGHHDISVGGGGYYAITGYARPANSNNDKQVLAQLPTDGSLAGTTVGPYRYVDVPALTVDTVSIAGTGYNGSPSQPATVSVTPNYTLTATVAPGSEVNILEPFVTGALWSFNNDNVLTLPSGGQLGSSGMGWTGLHGGNGYPLDVTSFYSSGNVSSQVFLSSDGSLSLVGTVDGGNSSSWVFNPDGSLTPPTQASNQRTGSGLTLKIGNENTQAIITGPAPVANSYNAAPRLVVAGQDGVLNGEGGDIYLWAGQSGPDGGTGGDIKVDGGLGLNGSEGGTIKVRSGNSVGGTGGFIEILGGHGDFGGPVTITSGYGNSQANSANVTIQTTYGGTWVFDTYGNLTLPNGALLKDTSGDSVAFGQNAGANSQYQHAVAIGLNAGYQYQGEDSVAIGFNAGYYNQGRGVAIGYQAGQGINQSTPVSATYGGSGPAHVYVSGTGNPSLVLDSVSGVVTYDQYVTGNNIPLYTYVTNIYPGEDRIEISQPPTAALSAGDTITFIGSNIGVASTSSLVAGARVLGTNIPNNTYINNILGPNNIDISQRPSAPLVDGAYLEFYIGQGGYATAIGYDAGIQYQDVNAVAVGRSAGTNHQGANTVAVGYVAGAYSQGANAVAIGAFAGTQTQGINTVAIGYHTGGNTQGARAVAIGEDAGRETQGLDAIAIGRSAGSNGQGNSAIAMGWNAGQDNQGQQAIAIGEDAGQSSLGEYSIAIGFKAGYVNQGNNSIVLNATGANLGTANASTFTVAPIRTSTLNNYSKDTGNVLYYNTDTHEVTTAPINNITGDPYAAYAGDSTANVTVWTASSDQVVGAKLTVRVVYASSGWTNTEMLDIMAAKNYPDGTPVFTVSNRIKTNPAYDNVLIDVTLNGSNAMQVISSAPSGGGNNVYWTVSATSFNQTFD